MKKIIIISIPLILIGIFTFYLNIDSKKKFQKFPLIEDILTNIGLKNKIHVDELGFLNNPFSKIQKDRSQLYYAREVLLLKGKPYTGFVFNTYKSGKEKGIIEFKNGIVDGMYYEFFEDFGNRGRLRFSQMFSKGVKSGPFNLYREDNGRLGLTGNYKLLHSGYHEGEFTDKKDGEFLWFSYSGDTLVKGNFKNDEYDGKWEIKNWKGLTISKVIFTKGGKSSKYLVGNDEIFYNQMRKFPYRLTDYEY